jgi:adenosylcobinamide kinase/adenosylcobinamide-phosphate guanylyltransferase
LVTGGARSGKSRHAQELALQYSGRPIYVATARAWDDEFKHRIRIHQQDRDERWRSIEEEQHLSRLSLEGEVAVIDCVTLWITNFFSDFRADVSACLEASRREIDGLVLKNALLIIITNELGMGMHADTEAGRKFTDLQGWINQYIAAIADEVIFMVSGIPLIVKGAPGVPPAMPPAGEFDDNTHKSK